VLAPLVDFEFSDSLASAPRNSQEDFEAEDQASLRAAEDQAKELVKQGSYSASRVGGRPATTPRPRRGVRCAAAGGRADRGNSASGLGLGGVRASRALGRHAVRAARGAAVRPVERGGRGRLPGAVAGGPGPRARARVERRPLHARVRGAGAGRRPRPAGREPAGRAAAQPAGALGVGGHGRAGLAGGGAAGAGGGARGRARAQRGAGGRARGLGGGLRGVRGLGGGRRRGPAPVPSQVRRWVGRRPRC
jgi:hypothetical protein